MKYCIGCKHWTCHSHQEGTVYSEYSSDSDTPANLACKKGHWQEELSNWKSDDANTEAIFDAMCLAETCADYEERPPPEPSTTK